MGGREAAGSSVLLSLAHQSPARSVESTVNEVRHAQVGVE